MLSRQTCGMQTMNKNTWFSICVSVRLLVSRNACRDIVVLSLGEDEKSLAGYIVIHKKKWRKLRWNWLKDDWKEESYFASHNKHAWQWLLKPRIQNVICAPPTQVCIVYVVIENSVICRFISWWKLRHRVAAVTHVLRVAVVKCRKTRDHPLLPEKIRTALNSCRRNIFPQSFCFSGTRAANRQRRRYTRILYTNSDDLNIWMSVGVLPLWEVGPKTTQIFGPSI